MESVRNSINKASYTEGWRGNKMTTMKVAHFQRVENPETVLEFCILFHHTLQRRLNNILAASTLINRNKREKLIVWMIV
jgi:hypothetical protein